MTGYNCKTQMIQYQIRQNYYCCLFCNLKGKTWLFSSFWGIVKCFAPTTPIRALPWIHKGERGCSAPKLQLNLAMTCNHCILCHFNPLPRFLESMCPTYHDLHLSHLLFSYATEIYHPNFVWYVETSSSGSINTISYHSTALELTNQLLYMNFPSLEHKIFQKNLKSTLPSSVAL